MNQPTKDKLAELQGKVLELEARLPTPVSTCDMDHGALAHFTFDVLEKNRLADALNPSPPPAPKKDSKDPAPKDPAAVLKGGNQLVPGKLGQAIEFTGDDPVDTPVGNFERREPFSVSLWLQKRWRSFLAYCVFNFSKKTPKTSAKKRTSKEKYQENLKIRLHKTFF